MLNFWPIMLFSNSQKILTDNSQEMYLIIIESVDSISRDGPDTPIYVIHYKSPN